MKSKSKTSARKASQLARYRELASIMIQSRGASYTEKDNDHARQYCVVEFVDESTTTPSVANQLPRALSRILNDIALESKGII